MAKDVSKKQIVKYKRYFIIILFFVSGYIKAQGPGLEQKVSLDYSSIMLGELLKKITEQTGVSFQYSTNFIDLNKKTSIHLNDVGLKEVLDYLQKNANIKYTLFQQQILLSKNEDTKYTISGYISEKGSRELLIGAVVYAPQHKNGVVSNNYGFYSLTLPEQDSLLLHYSYMGHQTISKKIKLDKDIPLNIDLDGSTDLEEVEVVAEKTNKLSETTQMSTIEIPVQQAKDIPALLGEKDILKVVQLMPGIQKGGEGSAGLYVRGGGPDQNLIILDDAPVYNAFHLFGFFSVFNGDAVKNVQLIKGGFPARYGGRLSSVMEMNIKDGNKEKIHGEGGIGLISSRLTLEGPLCKNKSSFLVSARRTYIDAVAAPIVASFNSHKDTKSSFGYFFYDINTKFNYDFSDKDKVYLSAYVGKDKFYTKNKDQSSSTDAELGWGNVTATARWNHLFGNRLFSNTSLVFTNYSFFISLEDKSDQETSTFKYTSGIRDYTLKSDFDFSVNLKHRIRFGAFATSHFFTPYAIAGTIKNTTTPMEKISEKIQVFTEETGVYIEDDYKPFARMKVNVGLRVPDYSAQGKNYFKVEPRFSCNYSLMRNFSLKASYTMMNQFVQLISNTGIGLPTDLWVPSSKSLPPQHARQVAAGIAKDIPKYKTILTVEGYYKKMYQVLNYKEGASFYNVNLDPDNNHAFSWEKNITSGRGWSYGLELLVQKKSGNFSGWIAYTLSWTQLQFDSLNFGQKFYAGYDRRHNLSLVGIYEIREASAEKNGITLSGTWVYNTGNAITLPVAAYNAPYYLAPSIYGGSSYYSGTSDYTAKNSYRMAAYHRLDIGIQLHKKKKWGERTWEISVYNLYNRQNPYYYFIGQDKTGNNVLKQQSLFPLIPSVSYNFKF